MNYLTQPDKYEQHMSVIGSLVALEKRLPAQVFKHPLSYFALLDADGIFLHSFFERMKGFISSIGENKFYLAVIEPHPESYFYRHFRKYPIIEMSLDDRIDEYAQIIRQDPGDSPADAIAYNGRVCLIYSDTLQWAIHLDRELGVAVASFVSDRLKQEFAAAYGSEHIFTVQEVMEQLVDVVDVDHGTENPAADIHEQLINNFGSAPDSFEGR